MPLQYRMGAVYSYGGYLVVLFALMQRNVMTNPACVGQEIWTKRRKKKNTSMGLRESVKFLLALTYILNLADVLTPQPPVP